MGTHGRAWNGINILLHSPKPLESMMMEQALAKASPANEVRFDSYENLDDIVNHWKEKSNVGLIVAPDTQLDLIEGLVTGFRSDSRVPIYICLYYVDSPLPKILNSIKRSPYVVDYIPSKNLTEPNLVPNTLNSLWERYIDKVDELLVPSALREELLQIASDNPDIQLCNQLTDLLIQKLNITWSEAIALKWFYSIDALGKENTAILRNVDPLGKVFKAIETSKVFLKDDLIDINLQDTNLVSRITQSVQLLKVHHNQNILLETLDTVSRAIKPGDPSILRIIDNHADQILKIASEINPSADSRHLEVA